MERRAFAAALSAAAAAPLLIGAAPGRSGHQVSPQADAHLQREMLKVLAAVLQDTDTARTVVPWILDIGFDWAPATAPVDQLDFIVAYSFGNRPPANGGDPTRVLAEPGPMNEQLADVVAEIRAVRTLPVYAQWEIAHFLTTKHGLDQVTAIEPVIAADGTITYLSTDGVAAQVAELRKAASGGIGTAGVVGWRDHIKRCVLTTKGRGMTAFAPEGFTMPDTYDPESGQPWTRRRDLYLVHDMSAQWTMKRTQLIAELYPNG
ncbi:hypothetical protein E0500_026935 [Streptomyces sp. KM273126]|uniref:hypothetical protein n=2 Tax=Streptomyces TaxID=1883 RepID=UPI0010395B35|nr:hypothetical protein [Streptomyces sp. KM273126]MBA2810935.1 hypothetical protein [Streptomyces sp. KM273126]